LISDGNSQLIRRRRKIRLLNAVNKFSTVRFLAIIEELPPARSQRVNTGPVPNQGEKYSTGIKDDAIPYTEETVQNANARRETRPGF